jgi:hypothetical protein
MAILSLLLGKMIACRKIDLVPIMSPAIMTLRMPRCQKQAGFFLDGTDAVISGLSARLGCPAAPCVFTPTESMMHGWK